MHDLQLLGVHDDGEHVVFLGADGQRYRAPIDDTLRAAVRRDRARLNQLQVSSQALRPRDIQALVRAGHTAQQIADEAGVPLEFVQRFEGPVLAERENIVWRARQTRVRRRDEIGPALGDLADERLEARGVSLGRGTVWDAWREDDGTWTVQVGFTAGGTERTAQWRYDVGASHLTPADDESKWLTSEHAGESGRSTGRTNRDAAAAQHEGALDRVLRRRLDTIEFRSPWSQESAEQAAPVVPEPQEPAAEPTTAEAEPEPVRETAGEEAVAGEEAGETSAVVDTPGPSPAEAAGDEAPSLVEAARTVDPEPDASSREEPALPAAQEETAPAPRAEEPAVARSTSDQDTERSKARPFPAELPPPAHPADSHPEDLPDATVLEPQQDAEPAVAAKPVIPKPGPRPTRRQTATRKGRASVPSWDDILFGSKKD